MFSFSNENKRSLYLHSTNWIVFHQKKKKQISDHYSKKPAIGYIVRSYALPCLGNYIHLKAQRVHFKCIVGFHNWTPILFISLFYLQAFQFNHHMAHALDFGWILMARMLLLCLLPSKPSWCRIFHAVMDQQCFLDRLLQEGDWPNQYY